MNPIPYQTVPADTFDPVTNPAGLNPDKTFFGDWIELMDNSGPGQNSSSTDGSQQSTLVGLIPFNKILSAQRWFEGFAYVDQSNGFLVRENPVFHPYLPHLRCASFSSKPYIPSAAGLSLQLKSSFVPTDGSNKTLIYGSYKYHIVTAVFSGFRYPFLGDSQVRGNFVTNPQTGGQVPTPPGWGGNEVMRYTYFDLAPRLETLSADNNSYLAFKETSAKMIGPPVIPAGPTIGTKFPVPNAVLMAKSDYILKWMNVPINYISEGDGVFSPTNILDRIGCVNKYPFLGFNPETLLLKAPSFDILPYYYPAQDGTTMYFCNITIPFDYFEPDNGNPASTHYGWQLMPYRVNGLWYYCERLTPLIFGAAALNGIPYLPETDMSIIFNNPNYFIGY